MQRPLFGAYLIPDIRYITVARWFVVDHALFHGAKDT
jgi:hypothetical protein